MKQRRVGPRLAQLVLLGLATLLLWSPATNAKRGKLPAWAVKAAARPDPQSTRDAVWLHIETHVQPLAKGGVRVSRRVAGRILGRSGVDALSKHAVAYQKNDEVTRLAAWNVSADGSITAAQRNKHITDIAAYDESSVYNDGRYRIVTAPGAGIGSFVAFESIVEHQMDTGARSFLFGELDRPVAFAQFSIDVSEGFQLNTTLQRGEGVIQEDRSETGVVMTGRDLEPVPGERYRPSASAILPVAWVHWWNESGSRGYPSWNDVANWYRELADPVLEDRGEASGKGLELKPAANEGFLKSLEGAFDFSARAVRYVSIQVGIGGYRPNSPAVVCKNRFGDCKDKTFLMRALVGTWDVQSFPVLVRTGDLGDVEPDAPSPAQFNHCIVAVRLPDGVGETLWNVVEVAGVGRLALLDATARYQGPWDLPTMDQGTLALVVHQGGGTLVRLPTQPPAQALATRKLVAEMDSNGLAIEGSLTESWSGTAAGSVRGYYSGRSTSELRREAESDLSRRFPGTQLDEFRIHGLENPGLDVVEQVQMTDGRIARRVDNTLLIIEPGKLARGLVKALPPPPRLWPIRIGQPREESVEASILLPAGWTPEALPEAVHIESQDVRAQASWSVEDGKMIYRRSASVLNALIPPERYEAFRDHMTLIDRADRQGIALVRP